MIKRGGILMDDVMYLMNSLWTMVSAILVIFMIAGFILLEAGSTRMKNAGHVAGKTVFTFGLSSLVFWAVGYGFIFGGDANFFIGMSDFFYGGDLIEGAGLCNNCILCFPISICRNRNNNCTWRICRTCQIFCICNLYNSFRYYHLSCYCSLDLGWWLVSRTRETRLCWIYRCTLNWCNGSSSSYNIT